MCNNAFDMIHAFLVPCLADVLLGFGLSTLLELSRVSPEIKYFAIISVGVLIALGTLCLLLPCQKLPAWVSICNTTYSLVLTVALSLNLISQLCPPSGKELSLIPVYVLLCIPRTPPSCKALGLLAGASLLLLGVFMLFPVSRHARPSGDVGSGYMLAVSLLAGGWLQTFEPPEQLNMHFYTTFTYDQKFWRAGAVVCKALLLVLIGSTQNTLYHFMYERSNTAVPMVLFLPYGILLLFGCMQTASMWFDQLRQILGSQAKWRLVVRIQHVICALIVAAAWVYPLQLHSLRLMILSALLVLNAVGMVAK